MQHKEFFQSYLEKYDVIFEDINKYNLKTNFPIIKDFIYLLKKFVNGQKKNLKNNSHIVYNIKFKEEIEKKKFFFLIKPISFFLNKFLILRKILVLIENFFIK